MIHKIQRYIDALGLLDRDASHLVALSGGADSVCLLVVLKRLGYHIEAVHCNFHLRGEESDRDENFCRELCEKERVNLHLVHFDTKTYALLHKVSIEMAARELRYDYFEQLRKDIGAEDVCVAHHKDDQAETILMNVIRGTGLSGLIGIRPINGRIKRPLLCVSRKEIVDFLTALGQGYVTDSSNLVNDVTRNRLRLDVIPMLQGINPAVVDSVVRMGQWMTEVEKLVNETSRRETVALSQPVDYIPYEVLDASVSAEYLLFTVLSPLGFSSEQVKEILSTRKTGAIWLAEDYEIVADRGRYVVAKREAVNFRPIAIPESGTYVLCDGKRIKAETIAVVSDFVISKQPDIATLDADRVRFPLKVRRVGLGDRFIPFGMKGTKLVSDYLTDRKLNVFEKRQQLVVEDADGKIIWLVGQRVDARVAIRRDTINCLILRYI